MCIRDSGYVSLRMRYSVSEEEADRMKEKKLVLQLPETMRYVEGSMIQAQNQSMAASVAYDADAGTLEIPLSQFGAELENTGYLRCMLMSMAAGNDTITPYLSFELEQDGPLQLAQPLGSVEIQSPKLNLKTAEKTGTAEITVQGNALPGKTVKIYDNGTEVGSTTVAKGGAWISRITLQKTYSRSYHTVYAVSYTHLTLPTT